MVRVRVSSKNQIVVPAEARKKLGIKPGDYLLVNVAGDSIVLIPEPESHVEALQGLGKEIWVSIDTDEWLRQERETWGNQVGVFREDSRGITRSSKGQIA